MTELEMDYGLALRNYRMAMETYIQDPTEDHYDMVYMWGEIMRDLKAEMAFQPKGLIMTRETLKAAGDFAMELVELYKIGIHYACRIASWEYEVDADTIYRIITE